MEVPKTYRHEQTISFPALSALKQQAKDAIKAVKPMFAGAPMLITRVDFGCCLKSSGPKEKRFFLNEIEFNPGMYLHADGQRKFNMDKKIAKQLVKVVKFNQLKAK